MIRNNESLQQLTDLQAIFERNMHDVLPLRCGIESPEYTDPVTQAVWEMVIEAFMLAKEGGRK